MKRHPGRIALIQWGMVGLYLFLLFAPLVFPVPGDNPFFWADLQRFSVFVFWGFGWPLIMLSTMLFGRIWCGIFCPEGALTEAISRHGKKRSIPRWIRWPGWPGITLIFYTLVLFLSGATRHHGSIVIVLGSLTFFALLTGFLFGNGRRVWCMYLCPSNAILAFLARLSPFYFRVDPEKWDAWQGPVERINCAPLINIKQMQSASACHACGRCSGYRGAVELVIRKMDHEILSAVSSKTSTVQALTLLFGMIGISTATLAFSRQAFGNLTDTSMLLTLGLISGSGMLLGGVLWGLMWLAYRITRPFSVSWQQLSLGLTPLAGIGLFTGFSTLFPDFIEPAHWAGQVFFLLQLLLLASAFLFSFWLGYRLIVQKKTFRHLIALTTYVLALSML
ncbi:MAG: 4Fe-4S binding protein, partial [Oxalobacter sp.]|nr:4Fe-4S binding protein [Oxalobacter sp.]